MVIKIGSDPEFCVKARKGRKTLEAGYVISGSLHDEIGLDGCSDVGEFRPPPATTVEEHLKNIERLIKRLLTEHPNYRFYGGSAHGGFPIGGHIHFSGVARSDELTRALDVLVALPVMMMEGQKAGKSRKRSYGTLSDVRNKSWGWEYRTLPSWLLSRVHAKTILETAMLVVKNASNLPMEAIDAIGLHTHRGEQAFKYANKEFFRQHIPEIFRILESFRGAANYKGSLDTFREWTETDHHWFQGVPLNGRWRLGRNLTAAIEVNSEPARNGTIVGHMMDALTESMATAVSDRFDTLDPFNEGLQRNYIIYGIRDIHGEELTCSHRISQSFIGSNRVISRNRGRAPADNQVRIGVSMGMRSNSFDRAVRLITRLIRHLESEL